MSKIQVLKSTLVSGSKEGRSYAFYRLACVYFDDNNQPQAVGDVMHDQDIAPGLYPLSFSVASFQGKLSAKLVPILTPAPSVAAPSK